VSPALLLVAAQIVIDRLPHEVADRAVALGSPSFKLLALLALDLCGDDDLGFCEVEKRARASSGLGSGPGQTRRPERRLR
jgi:hypothetical protein